MQNPSPSSFGHKYFYWSVGCIWFGTNICICIGCIFVTFISCLLHLTQALPFPLKYNASPPPLPPAQLATNFGRKSWDLFLRKLNHFLPHKSNDIQHLTQEDFMRSKNCCCHLIGPCWGYKRIGPGPFSQLISCFPHQTRESQTYLPLTKVDFLTTRQYLYRMRQS